MALNRLSGDWRSIWGQYLYNPAVRKMQLNFQVKIKQKSSHYYSIHFVQSITSIFVQYVDFLSTFSSVFFIARSRRSQISIVFIAIDKSLGFETSPNKVLIIHEMLQSRFIVSNGL